MQDKLLYNLVEEIAGDNNGRIVETLLNKKDVNEFLIAKKMELTVNQVRNILYKLSNFGLVSFNRKKDQKKGWYIYFWTLDNKKSLKLIETHLKNKIKNLEEQLKDRETKRYYVCPYCKIEVNEDVALENGFSCEECAEIYNLADNTPFVRDIKSKITRTMNEIQEIEKELQILNEKERKKVQREKKKNDELQSKEKIRKASEKSIKTSNLKAAKAKAKILEDKVNTPKTEKIVKKTTKPAATKKKTVSSPKKITKQKK